MSSFFIPVSGGSDFHFEDWESLRFGFIPFLLSNSLFWKNLVCCVRVCFMEITSITKHSLTKEKKYTDVNASSRVVVQSIEDMTKEGEPAISAKAFDPTLLRRVVDQIRNTFNLFDKRLHFRVNMEANTVVVEVVDSKTNTVIREIPSEEMQELKRKIQESTGAFVDIDA